MTAPAFNVAVIIPTGVGASIGGFGGDAMTLLPLLSSLCDTVITHPNVANAACFQSLPANTLYVEGYALDQFFLGRWHLNPVRQNRVGVIWDAGISADMEILHQNTMHAVTTVYGVDIIGTVPTSEPVEIVLETQQSGRSAGKLSNPHVLREAGQRLIDQGATALAVCCLMPEVSDSPDNTAYKQGAGVDPIGGVEAMISHWLVSEFQLPAAHAPVFSLEDALPVTDHRVDPRAASEFIVSTFLPCVLTGLAKAPQFSATASSHSLSIQHLSALIVPYSACGSIPVLSAIEKGIPVIAVQNNVTVMQCSPEALGLADKITLCHSYMEALGLLLSLKAGISLPEHFWNVIQPACYARA